MTGNERDLAYFIQLHNSSPTHTPDHAASKWDRRAEAWEQEYRDTGERKNDDRVQATAEFLRGRGLLGPDCDVADIGCGPGRFAAAFGRTARSVTGFDLSERMVRYGTEYVRQEGLRNVSLRVCDFQALDVEAEGLAGRFDLVLSSITPAVHGAAGLEKMMRMSRGFCCDITHISSENALESRMMREVFRRERPQIWSGRWFYSLFNVLFLWGYYPEVSYYRRRRERAVRPGEAYECNLMERLLPPRERTEENRARIHGWLAENADSSGMVLERSDTLYGRTLWDVRVRTDRPDYRIAEQEA